MNKLTLKDLEPGSNFISRHIGPNDVETRDMLRMANQIADFFRSYPHDDAVKEAATHLNNYWDPRMRKHFFDYLAKGGVMIFEQE